MPLPREPWMKATCIRWLAWIPNYQSVLLPFYVWLLIITSCVFLLNDILICKVVLYTDCLYCICIQLFVKTILSIYLSIQYTYLVFIRTGDLLHLAPPSVLISREYSEASWPSWVRSFFFIGWSSNLVVNKKTQLSKKVLQSTWMVNITHNNQENGTSEIINSYIGVFRCYSLNYESITEITISLDWMVLVGTWKKIAVR